MENTDTFAGGALGSNDKEIAPHKTQLKREQDSVDDFEHLEGETSRREEFGASPFRERKMATQSFLDTEREEMFVQPVRAELVVPDQPPVGALVDKTADHVTDKFTHSELNAESVSESPLHRPESARADHNLAPSIAAVDPTPVLASIPAPEPPKTIPSVLAVPKVDSKPEVPELKSFESEPALPSAKSQSEPSKPESVASKTDQIVSQVKPLVEPAATPATVKSEAAEPSKSESAPLKPELAPSKPEPASIKPQRVTPAKPESSPAVDPVRSPTAHVIEAEVIFCQMGLDAWFDPQRLHPKEASDHDTVMSSRGGRGFRAGGGYRPPEHRYYPDYSGAQRIDDDEGFRPSGYQGSKKPLVQDKRKKLTSRDKQRAEVYRERKNEQSGYDKIAEDINRTLHPGFASLPTAVKDLSITTKAAKTVPISTLALGPLVQDGVNNIRQMVNQLPPAFNKHAFYRVALGMLDARLYTQFKMRSRTSYPGNIDYQDNWLSSDRRDVLFGQKIHLLSVINYLNTVGNVNHNDVQYYVGVPRKLSPSTVTIQNLRACVELASRGPPAVRRNFFRNNPFPFAQYVVAGEGVNLDPTLDNGDEICPPNYNMDMFRADLEIVKQTCAMVQRKYPKKIGDGFDYVSPGHRAILVSSMSQAPDRLRAIPEDEDGNPLLNNIGGTVDSFWSSENNINDQDYLYASLTLTGHYCDAEADLFGVRSIAWACSMGHTNAITNMRVHY